MSGRIDVHLQRTKVTRFRGVIEVSRMNWSFVFVLFCLVQNRICLGLTESSTSQTTVAETGWSTEAWETTKATVEDAIWEATKATVEDTTRETTKAIVQDTTLETTKATVEKTTQEGTNTTVENTTVSSTTRRPEPSSTTRRPWPPGPVHVYVEPVRPQGLNVTWTLPQNSSASNYRVMIGNVVHCNTTDTHCLITSGLQSGTKYTVGVVACTEDNCSDATENSSYTYPSAPQDLWLVNQSVDWLYIVWKQRGGFDIFHVTVDYYNSSNVTGDISVTLPSTSSNTSEVRCFIRGLQIAGGEYTVKVSAEIKNLNSDAVNRSFLTAPHHPGDLTVVNRTTSEICVSWNQSGNVDEFSWSINASNTTVVEIFPSSHKLTGYDCDNIPCEWAPVLCVRGLPTPGELYEIEIVARTGNLRSSGPTKSVVTAPKAPKNITCTSHSNSTLTVLIEYPAEGKFDDIITLNYSSQWKDFEYIDSTTALNGSSNITDLKAGVTYRIEARTQSYSIFGKPFAVDCTTNPNIPRDFSATRVSASSITLIWTKPGDGFVSYYEIRCTGGSKEHVEEAKATESIHTLSGLLSDTKYMCRLLAASDDGVKSEDVVSTSKLTLPGTVSINVVDRNDKAVTVNWTTPSPSSNIGAYILELKKQDHSCMQQIIFRCSDSKHLQVDTSVSVEKNCKNDSKTMPCDASSFRFDIDGLKPLTNYTAVLAAINPSGTGAQKEAPFMTLESPSFAWVAGVVVGIFLAIILVASSIFLFVYLRRNQYIFSFAKKRRGLPDSISGGGEENLVEPEPVRTADFIGLVNKLGQDSNYLFACEYLLLAKLSPQNPAVEAELEWNRAKNRYTDILPFDCSRVKLVISTHRGDDDESDYINASFLPGFNSKREYIAAQGPMRSTLDDFWLMIWQQKVSTIVMVTNLVERGREKCYQYWPENTEPLCYGEVTVALKSESPSNEIHVVRVLEASVGSEKRQITQYHFLVWPDFGVPDTAEQVVDFVREVRGNFNGNSPMLVHCSAGVGRTGTFVIVDHLLQLIRRDQYIDLFHLVLELRQHRPKMIQAESQYIFAHECIKLAIERGYHIPESTLANGDCLYANSSEVTDDPPLYANFAAGKKESLYMNSSHAPFRVLENQDSREIKEEPV